MPGNAVAIETTARQVSDAEAQNGLEASDQDGSFEIEDVPTLPISHLDTNEVFLAAAPSSINACHTADLSLPISSE